MNPGDYGREVREHRQASSTWAIELLARQYGPEMAKRLVDAVGRPEAIAAFTRIMAAQQAQQLHDAGVTPRAASYLIAERHRMSVRNARRYADGVTKGRVL